MADLGKAYVQIIPKAEGITGKIKDSISPGAKQAGKEAGSNIAGNIKKVIAGAAIGATVVKGFQAALDAGGKLQQSYGGLETLYGDAADAAKKYAAEAAQAGISANSYAEQAVSFGASLKAAFGGDTAAAAEAANTAILDMADNAAKMGTPLESIQNAYQGFAKGNYTMLDNLKLGYGGTKSEMERLLADATKLTGVKYDMDNLGDVYSAIHAIQGDLGLTGVAAQEAATTFTGSFGAMKAAAENVLANLSTGGDVEGSMQQLASSAGTFLFDNLIPMIGNVISAIPGAVSSFISAAVPSIMESGKGLIDGIISGAEGQLPMLTETVPSMIESFGATITENLPTVLEKGGEFITSIIEGMLQKIPEMAGSMTQIVEGISSFLQENIPVIGEKGGEIVMQIGSSIVENLPEILVSVGKLSMTIIQALAKLVPTVFRSGVTIISGLARGMGGSALGLVKGAMAKIKSAMEKPIEDAKATIKGILENIKGFFPLSIGRIFSNIALPHFSVNGGQWPYGIGGRGYMPSFGVDWYAKAMEQPYLFNRASLIGVGEAGDEMVYGRSALLRDIRQATQGGGQTNVYVTVNGAENPEDWAARFAKELKMQARTA